MVDIVVEVEAREGMSGAFVFTERDGLAGLLIFLGEIKLVNFVNYVLVLLDKC